MYDANLRKCLEELLLPQVSIKERVFIWGTGNTAFLYQEGLKRLEGEGFSIEAYVDNDSKKWGKEFCGKRIVSPLELQSIKKDVSVLICSPQPDIIRSLSAQLTELGVNFFHIDEIIFKMHAQELLKVFDDLEDDSSKETYYSLVEARMAGSDIKESLFCENQYFALPKFRMRNPKEVFVDCGAFVGDTVEEYIWKKDGVFEKIAAFEPDKKNFEAMQRRVERLQDEWHINRDAIELYQYAVSNEMTLKGVEAYEKNNGLGSKIVDNSDSGENCQVVAIDEMKIGQISFLKADIEGYEYKMLLGASESIRKWRPRLAVCIYHNAVDFYSIPLLIKSLVPEYKIAVRQHSYQLDDTVLYAWTE